MNDKLDRLLLLINEALRMDATFTVYRMDGRVIVEIQKNAFPILLRMGNSVLDAIADLDHTQLV